ncbi:GNAT family N-acetyltransferase [Holdemanella biformis]|uniref:GNAT family N-acetyltransferase n=1 Tax=Holdemanella biformis TaxID=1735 RepID=A0A395WAJ4_9FIRM|nr:GNAT family N-acetyltransferase [Holdemanella biformis]RGU73498.1 GNAT family N-acetyltransferase [Holdemanella biformis]RGU93125.1 GNAT family N-acetyltransferase [Holdemanella biformis]
MNTKTYTTLPQEAKDIRIKVFMKEQGFESEFDDIDQISSHIVVFDETKPVGTCRFFKENNHYTIGRVAVLKEYRNQHIGNLLLKSAEKEIKKLNGDLIVVHAQVRVSPFYENQGYIQFGQIDDDEGVPHMWMKKKIQY